MKIWQAHLALAQMIGDPIAISGSPVTVIPDGVRYSKNLRDIYLYRAMLGIINSAVEGLAAQPVQVSDILTRMMPNFIIHESVNNLNALVSDVSTGDYRWELQRRPVAIISVFNDNSVQFRRESLPRFHNNVSNPYIQGYQDPTFTQFAASTAVGNESYGKGNVILRFNGNYSNRWSGTVHHITYIPTPINPADQTPETPLDFEPMLFDKVLLQANTYAKIDAQEAQG